MYNTKLHKHNSNTPIYKIHFPLVSSFFIYLFFSSHFICLHFFLCNFSFFFFPSPIHIENKKKYRTFFFCYINMESVVNEASKELNSRLSIDTIASTTVSHDPPMFSLFFLLIATLDCKLSK